MSSHISPRGRRSTDESLGAPSATHPARPGEDDVSTASEPSSDSQPGSSTAGPLVHEAAGPPLLTIPATKTSLPAKHTAREPPHIASSGAQADDELTSDDDLPVGHLGRRKGERSPEPIRRKREVPVKATTPAAADFAAPAWTPRTPAPPEKNSLLGARDTTYTTFSPPPPTSPTGLDGSTGWTWVLLPSSCIAATDALPFWECREYKVPSYRVLPWDDEETKARKRAANERLRHEQAAGSKPVSIRLRNPSTMTPPSTIKSTPTRPAQAKRKFL